MALEPSERQDTSTYLEGGAFYGSVFFGWLLGRRTKNAASSRSLSGFQMGRGRIVTTYKKKLIEVAIPLEAN